MRKTTFAAFLAALFATGQAGAANYFDFNDQGQLTSVSIKEGFGSKRIGFNFAGREGVSQDCRDFNFWSLPPEYRPALRRAEALGIQAKYSLACSVETPLIGKEGASTIQDDQGGVIRVYSSHHPGQVVIMAAP